VAEVVDWDAAEYRRVSDLQRWLAERAISGLELEGVERVLDVGCGDGRITTRIAIALARGEVVGIDPSPRMVKAAASADMPPTAATAHFEIGDVLTMRFHAEFDLVVSFNALHWVIDQRQALARIAAALRAGGRALLVMVCAGPRRSLEQVAMDIVAMDPWRPFFADFAAPFAHVEPERFGDMAASMRLATVDAHVDDLSWDFGSAETFRRWCRVGFGAWTSRLPDALAERFVDDVAAAYAKVSGSPQLFRFMQLRSRLVKRR
jgi:trans-aconitate 2-methyltransferase